MKNTKKIFLQLLTVTCVGLLSSFYPVFAQKIQRFDYAAMLRRLASEQTKYVETTWLHHTNFLSFRNTLQMSSFFAIRNNALLLRTSPTLPLSRQVKTTDSKWIYSNIFYSKLFSQPEKTLLLHESSPKVKLGQISFLHDRHAAIFNQLNLSSAPLADEDILAFNTHQEKLQNLFYELNFYYQKAAPEIFVSAIFSEEAIRKMVQGAIQPPAYIWTLNELHTFSQLSDLSAQQQWIRNLLQVTYHDLGKMQEIGKDNLGAVSFERYYLQKMRYDYLRQLYSILLTSSQKRSSMIMRYRHKIEELGQEATDAQYLGYARFKMDTNPTTANKEYYQHLVDLYAPYAAAEVFEKPYEMALERGENFIFLLGETKGQYLASLSNTRAIIELPQKIVDLKIQMADLRAQTPNSLDFYKRYYQLGAELDIYASLLARSKFFEQYGQ